MADADLVPALARLAALAAQPFGVDELLAELSRAATRVLDVDGVGVMHAEPGTGPRRFTRFVHGDPVVHEPEQLQETLQDGPCRQAVDTRAPVVLEDLDDARDRWPSFVAGARRAGLGSVLALPLVSRDQGWGSLDLYREQPGPWGEEELTVARMLADIAVGYLVMAHERDQARAVRGELEYRSLHDPLTGLANRHLLFDRIRLAIASAARQSTPVGMLFIDLDRFKQVNDTCGHAVGDAVLVHVAALLRAAVRAEDTLARLAGDEFVVICTDLPATATGRTDALTGLAERITRSLAESPAVVDGVPTPVTASIGITLTLPTADVSAQQLLHHADLAMYEAKELSPGAHVLVHDTAAGTDAPR